LDFEATNVSYCNGEQLDVFVPKSATPVPLVIYIHGGGWRYGGKTGATFEDIKPLVNDGYAVASINYRLSNRAKFPAQIQDVFCSIRYLRHNAAQYKIDGERVGVVGISAGAHLAALAATASDQPDFTVGPFQEQSNQVQAAVLMSGLFDLESEQIQEETSQNLQRLLSGTMYNRGTISPSYYASEEDASQFIIYGTKDKLVSTTQSLNYALQLASLGVATQTLVVEHANHNLQPHFYYKTEPSRQQVTELIAKFFNDKLIAEQ
jgi:acetyl esterase/lipase